MIEIQPKTKSIHDRLDMRELFQKVADKKESIDKLIGTFINRCGYTDISPVGQVIAASGRTLHLRRVITTTEWPINKTELKWEKGGFGSICVNQYEQKWGYEITDDVIEMRVSKQAVKTLFASDEPIRFYDYNF